MYRTIRIQTSALFSTAIIALLALANCGKSPLLTTADVYQPALNINDDIGVDTTSQPVMVSDVTADLTPSADTPTDDQSFTPAPDDIAAPNTPDVETVNGASFFSTSFPSEMSCGEEHDVFIEMKNTGTSTWTRAESFKLGTVGDEDPFHLAPREWLPEGIDIAPEDTWVFMFKIEAPDEDGIYTSDWQMVQESVGWFGEVQAFEITVNCPTEPEWTFSESDENSILEHATFVRDNYPQFFNIDDDPNKRIIAYEMMTTVLNRLRAHGVNVTRCVANGDLPTSSPYHWCSDALVVGPPGKGTTIDIYQSWSYPAMPQIVITQTEATGTYTDDLIPLP